MYNSVCDATAVDQHVPFGPLPSRAHHQRHTYVIFLRKDKVYVHWCIYIIMTGYILTLPYIMMPLITILCVYVCVKGGGGRGVI